MMITQFEYLYRDAGNYKAFGAVLLDGPLSTEELERVPGLLANDGRFIAEQIGVPALYGQLYQWSDGPTQDDHCWHEFLAIRVVDERDVSPDAYRWGSAEHFLRTLATVRTWKEERSPHFSTVGHGSPESTSLSGSEPTPPLS